MFIRKIRIITLSTLLIFLLSFVSFALGDYMIESNETNSSVIIIAIHGGKIEIGTTEIARSISQLGKYNYYSFIGVMKSNNSSLHITSTKFNEEKAIKMVTESKTTISIHGCAGVDKVTYIGGLDTELGKKIKKNLIDAGFKVEQAPENLSGTSKDNIANKNIFKKGIQLELTNSLRYDLLSDTKSMKLYIEAINNALI